MTHTINVPIDDLRVLAKWAYYSAAYDGATNVEDLESLARPISRLVREIHQLDDDRKSSDFPASFAEL
ncbi:hypothetical protein ACMTN4_07540 [Rhodococcus globerulus]|uniref:hypothetical protein n=1 Tax=Rhodococcus globerulus TaxID=33008 RepID=UPI0039E941F2